MLDFSAIFHMNQRQIDEANLAYSRKNERGIVSKCEKGSRVLLSAHPCTGYREGSDSLSGSKS